MREFLRKTGFFRIEESISRLTAQAERMVEKAGTEEDCEKFEALPSYIDPAQSSAHHQALLTIDVGGTHSRVGLRTVSGSFLNWLQLINVFNEELKSDLPGASGLQRFAAEMARQSCVKLKQHGMDRSLISGLGIVWSNALENRVESGSIKGLVTQRRHYKKNEWFISDLKDGTEINAPFECAFREQGINIRVSLVGNDTPLTLKAADSADSGAVVSTGMNGTILKHFAVPPRGKLRRVVCNAEMGGRMIIPAEMRSSADLLDNDCPAQYIESLSAGKSLPQLFNSYIRVLAREGLHELAPLAAVLGPVSRFQAADLGALLTDPSRFAAEFNPAGLVTSEVANLLMELSRALLVRAARLSGIMAYATICNQLTEKNHFRIALESRLCREIPLYFQTMTEQLAALMPQGKQAELVLLEPLRPDGGSISVPMQGAAAALDNLLAG